MALIRRSIPVANFALTALIAAAVAFGVVAAEPVQSENAGGGKVVGGGKKTVRAARSSAASASPRVTADVLHRCSMDAANAWGVVIDGKPGPRFFNYQVQLVVTPKGTWLACWTQGTIEAAADQRVVVARSLDGGRSWSSEIAVEEAGGDYRVPAWGVPFVVPGSGRIYVFYWFNYNNVKLRDAGDIFFRFSDDDGVHWSPRRRIGVPRTDMDRGEPGDLHGWNFGQPRIFPGGQVIFTYTKIRRSSLYPEGWRLTADNRWQPDGSAKVDPARPPGKEGGSPNNWATEVFFVEMPNILSERDPTKLEFRFLPKGGSGLWAPYPKTDRHFGQEGTLTATFGRPTSVRVPHPARPPILRRQLRPRRNLDQTGTASSAARRRGVQPACSPCPMAKLPDGRFVLVFHNARPEGWGWHPRDPLWISVGREAPGVKENAGLSFTKPRVLVYNDGMPGGPYKDFEICYPSFYQFNGRCYVAYANKTSQIRISKAPAPLLDDSERTAKGTR